MGLSELKQYGIGFQSKVISCLLTRKNFLQNINDILIEDYFENQGLKWIVKEILKYYGKYHTSPTLEVLKTEMKKLENEILQISIKEQLKEAYILIDSSDLDYVEQEFHNFCKNQQLKKALLSSVNLLKEGEYDSIRHLIDNALKSGQDKNIGHEYNKDIEERYRLDSRKAIPTPWEEINKLLQGGLGGGDLGLVFGGPGGGKSWGLVALGAFATKLGYNVVHYTLELSEIYLGLRYDAFYNNIPVNFIKDHKKKVLENTKNIEGKLVIKEYPMKGASISTIESHLQKVVDLEFKPDLIIIDYIDLLSSKRRNFDAKEEIDDIYTSTKGLARKLNLPIWSVSQVNRAGSKDVIIEGDKASGSYNKMAVADFALSFSRNKEDKIRGKARGHIMKNRYGGDGMTYTMDMDTSTGHIIITGNLSEEEENYLETKMKPDQNGFNSYDKEKLAKEFFSQKGQGGF